MSAWKVIDHRELSSNQASIVFSSIPQTYTDLYLTINARSTRPSGDTLDPIDILINGDVGSGKSIFYLSGTFNTNAITQAGFHGPTNNATANTYGSASAYFPNYTVSGVHPMFIEGVSQNDSTTLWAVQLNANLSVSTAPITSLTIDSGTNNNLVQYTSATLYGITKGSFGGVTVS